VHVCISKSCAGDVRAGKSRLRKPRAGHVRGIEVRAREVRAGEVRASEPRASESRGIRVQHPQGGEGPCFQFCRLIRSAARSAMARTVALVFAPGREGITDASTTRNWSIPRTRSCRSVTAEASVPILQVPTGWK
jgi:hypothetical protein